MKKRSKLLAKNSVNIATLKAKLSQYLGVVKGGTELVITDHKMPVARIVPIARPDEDGFVAQQPTLPLTRILKMISCHGEALEGVSSTAALLRDRAKR